MAVATLAYHEFTEMGKTVGIVNCHANHYPDRSGLASKPEQEQEGNS